jgi:4-amino-4-deoxy-L-arabinose transferase-like glycosyltransferase
MKFSFFTDSDFFASKQLNERIYWILLSFVLVFVAVVRYRLLDFPLERDEGEYAYMGQLLLQGIPPYKFAYNMKLPGTYGMYALIMGVFGETIRGIHMGFLVMNLVTIGMLYVFVKKIGNSFVALATAAAYGVYSLNPYVLGFAAHATHFLLFWSLPGIYLLLGATEKKTQIQYFIVGLFFGFGFLMKQQAVFLIVFSGLYFLYHSYTEFKAGSFSLKDFLLRGILLVAGTVLPFLLTVGILYAWGVFPSFWYWTFQYASKYAGMSTMGEGKKNLTNVFLLLTFGYKTLWALVGFGLILSLFIKADMRKKIFLVLLFLFSFLTTTPGLYFREHYFITFLPFAFIYFGISLEFLRILLLRKLNLILTTVLICLAFLFIFRFKAHKEYYFKENPIKLSRIIYGVNPFQEAIKISEYIKANTKEDERIVVLGSEPEIYFYSERKSATGFIYMYPLMEIHPYSKEMQMNLVKDMENNPHSYLVYVNKKLNFTWGILKDSETYLIDWIEKNKNEKYELVGVAEILSLDETVYKWGDEAKSYKPKSDYYIEILKKK